MGIEPESDGHERAQVSPWRPVAGDVPDAVRDAWRPDDRHRVLAEQLHRFGLWDHLPAEARADAVADVASGGYPLDFDLLYERIEFFADGESLAEGGVERFLGEIAPALARFGLYLQVQAVEQPYLGLGHGDYVLSVNGIGCTIWNADDWSGGNTWEQATARPLAVVNQLLASAGTSRVRAHTLYAGGNEGILLLMDPRAAEAMRASGLCPDHEVPALAAAGQGRSQRG
ncbi:hypothetical protein [Streptacidiphilus sp. EB103A]|uniref:hypothetical protein n=1 Tax=Streptacidiphilus sp. EB103A TaxID=3156275 RepID=UPI00351510D9